MSRITIAQAIDALRLEEDGLIYDMPLITEARADVIVANVRRFLGALQAVSTVRAEAELNGGETGMLDSQDYRLAEHMLLGTLEHALAVAGRLMKDPREGAES